MAKDDFFGREEEQDKYRNFLANQDKWILIISGAGGSGKTRLLEHLKEQEVDGGEVISLDLQSCDSETKFLDLFAYEIRESCHKGYKSCEDFIERCLDGQLQQKISNYHSNINVDVGNDSNLSNLKAGITYESAADKIQRAVQHLVRLNLYRLMETFTKNRLVLLMDHCEWANEEGNEEIAQWIASTLATLQKRMKNQNKQLHIVMMSNVQETSQLQFPLTHTIEDANVQHHPLDNLGTEAVEKYFNKYLKMKDVGDADIYPFLYDITQCHAACVEDFCEFWRSLKEKDRLSRESTNDEKLRFTKEFYTYVSQKGFIDRRIFKRLKDPYYDLTRYGIILRRFNRDTLFHIFDKVFKHPPSREDEKRFYKFVMRTQVMCIEDEHMNRDQSEYKILPLLRTIYSGYIRTNYTDEWTAYHEKARNSFNIPHLVWSPANWFYHHIALHLAKKGEQDEGAWAEFLSNLSEDQAENIRHVMDAVADETFKYTLIPQAAKRLLIR